MSFLCSFDLPDDQQRERERLRSTAQSVLHKPAAASSPAVSCSASCRPAASSPAGECKEEDRKRMVKGENSTQRNAEDQMRSTSLNQVLNLTTGRLLAAEGEGCNICMCRLTSMSTA